jgi:hypothetical protein
MLSVKMMMMCGWIGIFFSKLKIKTLKKYFIVEVFGMKKKNFPGQNKSK